MIFQVSVNEDKLGIKQGLTLGLPKIQDANPREKIDGKFILKIVKTLNQRTVKNGQTTTELLPTVVKDIEGTSTQISFWNNHVNLSMIKEGNIYFITNLVAEKFPNFKPHFLATRLGTKVELAPADISKMFEGINYADDTVTGKIVGFQDVSSYKVIPQTFFIYYMLIITYKITKCSHFYQRLAINAIEN